MTRLNEWKSVWSQQKEDLGVCLTCVVIGDVLDASDRMETNPLSAFHLVWVGDGKQASGEL